MEFEQVCSRELAATHVCTCVIFRFISNRILLLIAMYTEQSLAYSRPEQFKYRLFEVEKSKSSNFPYFCEICVSQR